MFFNILELRHGLLTSHLTVVMGFILPCDKLQVTVCSALQQRHHNVWLFCFACFWVCWATLRHFFFFHVCHFHVQIWTLYSPPHWGSPLSLKYAWFWELFLKWLAEGPKCFQSHVFTHICCIPRLNHLLLRYEGESLFQSYLFCTYNCFLLAPDSHLYLNKFEALIVSSQMLFLMFISHIFYILYDFFCLFCWWCFCCFLENEINEKTWD